jgi:acyl-CoA thioester hydrolase
MTTPPPDPIYRYEFTIRPETLDANGHVNNVHYVQWMQDVAVHHFESLGGTRLTQQAGATWVVRSHNVEYLSPAFAGERIEARTWVADVRRVRSLRRYEFVRLSDGKLLVRGATEWVFVDAKSGRPLAIPEEVVQVIPLIPDGARSKSS